MSTITTISGGSVSSSAANDGVGLAERYRSIRTETLNLVAPLTAEDCAVQAMAEASPAKWHLAHSTWFFETFVLAAHDPKYAPFDETYLYLFNSYYNSVGRQYSRPHRGLLTRPSLDEVLDYRRAIDDRVLAFIEGASNDIAKRAASTILIGLNHEQQHQELILTDIKALFWANPLRPAYQVDDSAASAIGSTGSVRWVELDDGLREIGFSGEGFCYDNETPRHRVWLDRFALSDRPVTNGEFIQFIEDGGYARSDLWLSDGWIAVGREGWHSPLYWEKTDGGWENFTLAGMRPVDLTEPVCHVSYFESDAYARWAGARLPTESEWESAADGATEQGALLEGHRFHPAALVDTDRAAISLRRMIGDVWEWTSSAYSAYPGYRTPEGAIGEYNAKFMCNQFVLRGGSCATSGSHVRGTYRNYFSAAARWQFSGLRLARNA